MKILVCVKQVLDPTGLTVNRKAEKIFINREEYILDPACKAALEAAYALKQTDTEVIAISVGPERVEEALREALARGADRAIWIRSDSGDAQVVANLIAAAVRRLEAIDLILTGQRALDTGAGELAPRLAEALDWPQILGAVQVDVKEGVQAISKPANFVQVAASFPAVISVSAETYRGSHADGWRLMDAYKKGNIEAWHTADLELGEDDLRSSTSKKEDAFPPERQRGTSVRDVKELVLMLKREKIIA